LSLLSLALLLLVGCAETPDSPQLQDSKIIILATTTSTQDSGLLDALIPIFEERSGYRVKTIAVGTGEALAMGRRGDADVLLTHAAAKEKELIADGSAINRRIVMHNDFLIVGPEDDPAGIHGSRSGAESVAKIAKEEARLASRGDDSGTYIREMALWEAAGIKPEGDWYIESGQGMGATLLIADQRRAYVLTDRGTYLAFRERLDLVMHVEGDPLFLNIYSVMEVNPERFPLVNPEGARALSEFLRGGEAQKLIRTFGVEKYGQPLFFPDAGRSEEELAN
jgi:tungstate transport system substrate-binding protein